MNLGIRLKELIEEKNIQQQQFADIFNLSKQAVSSYISGHRTPNDELKKQFADFFNVSLDYLMGRSNYRYIKLTFEEFLQKYIDDEETREQYRKEFEAGNKDQRLIMVSDLSDKFKVDIRTNSPIRDLNDIPPEKRESFEKIRQKLESIDLDKLLKIINTGVVDKEKK